MGVTQLWQVLGPVEQHVPLSSLNGLTLAVDLSIWVCENQCVKQMQGVVAKPFLRNLFFRISHLTQLGVKLVFVIEGAAPELKWDTMVKRQQTRYPERPGKQGPPKQPGKQTRRNFNTWLKECCELLEIMGIPYVQSRSEAEALCALLNAAGLVDGCLTNDGDAFLYGAKTVYRNFTMNNKDPHVEMFNMSDIEGKLGIDRSGLIALGLLVGCDFVPKGVPGIGVANSVRLLQSLQGQDVLTRLQLWKTMAEKDCVDQVEVLARRKAVQVPDFPQTKVIDEFLVVKDRCPSQLPQWKRPFLTKLQEFALAKLEWPVEYTLEKILPLLTLWDMQDILQSKNPSVRQHLRPHRIVKTRVRQGEPCYEIEWNRPVTECVNEDIYYVTIESQELFSQCYPQIVTAFEDQNAENKKKPKAKKKKKKATEPTSPTPALDNLSFQFEKINLNAVKSGLNKAVEDLHPSFTEYVESTLTTKAKQPRHLTLSPNSKKPATKTAAVDAKGDNSESNNITDTVDSLLGRKLNLTKKSPPTLVEEGAVMSLSDRVKLRMKDKSESNKVKPATTPVLSSPKKSVANFLSDNFQNLSLKADNLPALYGSKQTPSCAKSRLNDVKKSVQMSSPSTDSFCSPMTYMKHKGNLGDSFEIQKSPYYIECPTTLKQKSASNELDINSPGFFTRRKSEPEPKPVDTRSTALKLAEKLESGIQQVGKTKDEHSISLTPTVSNKKPSIDVDEPLTLKSLQALLNNSTGSIMTPKNVSSRATNGIENQSTPNTTSLSEFGDFGLQSSLLNSMCTSIMQALTPKGVSMTKEEYEQLVATINEIDSEDNSEVTDFGEQEGADVENDIDLAEIEKVSTNFKKMNQNLLIRPIQIDDEDVMSKLSKSARKKLRRKERKVQEMENLAKLQNMNKQRLNKKQESDLKTRLSHSNDDNDGTKRKKQIICSPSKDSSKSKNKRSPLPNKGGNKNNLDTKKDTKTTEDIKSPGLDQSATREGKDKCAEIKHELKQAHDAKIAQEIRKQNSVAMDSGNTSDVAKKKKKRKKKVKKASPVIDLSGNDSMLDSSKIAVCDEYLRKALSNLGQVKTENKIQKASPFMDLSADNTLLELEGLSCKVVGEELDSELDSKLKLLSLKQKKLSSKNKSEDTSNNPPILSLVNSSTKTDEDRKTDSLLENETDSSATTAGYIKDVDTGATSAQQPCACTCSGDDVLEKRKQQNDAGNVDSIFKLNHDSPAVTDELNSESAPTSDTEQDIVTYDGDGGNQWCVKSDKLDCVDEMPQVNIESNSSSKWLDNKQELTIPGRSRDSDNVNTLENGNNDIIVIDVDDEVECVVANGNTVVDVARKHVDNDNDEVDKYGADGDNNNEGMSSVDASAMIDSGVIREKTDDFELYGEDHEETGLENGTNETSLTLGRIEDSLICSDVSNQLNSKSNVNKDENLSCSRKSDNMEVKNTFKTDQTVEMSVSDANVSSFLHNDETENTSTTNQVEKYEDLSYIPRTKTGSTESTYSKGTLVNQISVDENIPYPVTRPINSEAVLSGNTGTLSSFLQDESITIHEDSSNVINSETSAERISSGQISSIGVVSNVTCAGDCDLGKENVLGSINMENHDISVEETHSPACLADRLKQKLIQRSSRNLLDTFTNAK